MKVGDILKMKQHPDLGVGIIVELHRMRAGYQGRYSGCIAIFGNHGKKFVPRDCVEVINESR